MAQGQPGTDQRGEQCGGVAGADQGRAGGCEAPQENPETENNGMSDIKLFQLSGDNVTELAGKTAKLEKELQNHIEANMDILIGVRLLGSEYSTGKTYKGRIDSLGLDENGCPVIVEYKRHSNENVINQGLFYLDWLLDHQAEFKWLVMEKIGKAEAENIEWGGTRLICIASDFNKYDEHAVQQINRNIELMRYRYFGNELLLLELVNAQTANQTSSTISTAPTQKKSAKSASKDKSQEDRLAEASPALLELYQTACSYIEQLADEVQRKELKLYTAFKSRSEERRVGKECRSRWSQEHEKKKRAERKHSSA